MLEPLRRNCQEALCHRQQQRFDRCCIPNERADRGQPRIAAASAVSSTSFQVIQERQDTRSVQIRYGQFVSLLTISLLQKANEQLEGVAVGADRLRAEVALANEVLAEVLLQRRAQRIALGERD